METAPSARPKGTAEQRKVVMGVMQEADDSEWDEEYEAGEIVAALEALREAKAKYVVVSQITFGDGIFHLFASGPYSTPGAASTAGKGFAFNGAHGKGRWKVAPILPSPADAWKLLIEQRVRAGTKPWGWNRDDKGQWYWNKKEFAKANPETVLEFNQWAAALPPSGEGWS